MEPFTNFIEKMKNDKRTRTPFYDDNADYNTNSKSYYDDLARKAKVIELLTQRVWQYDEELRKRFERWDKLMDQFPEVAEQLFREWLRDGTIEKIIREELEVFKDEVRELFDDIDEYVNGFDLRKMEPIFINGISGVRNAVNQSINIDYETNHIYTTQSDSKKPEGFHISKLSPSGHLLSTMWIEEGGHGTNIGIERKTNGELKIWFYHTGLGKLIFIPFHDNTSLTLDDAKQLTDMTPTSLKESGFAVMIDQEYDKVVVRHFDARVEVRSRQDLVDGIDNIEQEIQVDPNENNDDRAMQGLAVNGNDLYWQSGWGDLSNPTKVIKYDLTTGEEVYTRVVDPLPLQRGNNDPYDSYREPEGLFLHVNPISKKQTLLMVYTTGGLGKRYNIMYGFVQTGAMDHWYSMTQLGSQNYKLTKDDGRALSTLDTYTSLNDINEPGEYYLTAKEADRLGDLPYPVAGAGWWVFVSAYNQNFGVIQTIKRASGTRKIISFSRTGGRDRMTGKWSFGIWTVNTTNSHHQEYLNNDDWNDLLANVTIPGEYYITAASTLRFNDTPTEFENVGCWLNVTSGNNGGQIRQELKSNSSLAYVIAYRNVQVETNEPTHDWNVFTLFEK
ncbi:MAG: phage baseplate protein [Staphylococcus saprophyticus]